jgi:hypothetical protein
VVFYILGLLLGLVLVLTIVLMVVLVLISQPMNFTYDGPMRPFLLALRAQVIPASLIPFLYDITPPVSLVDGCLVVEIQDFRKSPEVRTRVVMRQAAESLAQTIDVMLERKGEPWDEQLALELESRIIVSQRAPVPFIAISIKPPPRYFAVI